MPWYIERQGTKYCVTDKFGEVLNCHDTREQALAHQRALYANADHAMKSFALEALSYGPFMQVKKSQGLYTIKSVSTAAIQDREGETFTTRAIDYDIMLARRTNKYPEYRVFHSPLLGIGMVTKMQRVGIFAVEEGISYDDEFSLEVCKQLADNNDGRWRTSRGFYPLEVQFSCNYCNNPLSIERKHMLIGFICPVCKSGHITYKGMNGVRYQKACTFDITATDVPMVPMTGFTAFKNYSLEAM